MGAALGCVWAGAADGFADGAWLVAAGGVLALLGVAAAFAASGLGRCMLPAIKSKRIRRHSIGPFHMGTRRDSFRRMRRESCRSGLSIQAVQPL